ncbi:hypothetical protein I316_05358 [Kwoniella heveanensis BCC8398]|uniref:Zn(2)-C6 fungal-type domain-containing protein n=1 Tax=Kwoniella heveanensis BCC8398 TaxID=1296120 RepID=A0A1B9GPM0_9TREE|nr:hypothetical protein I316_05358 [Kwoniella heveanensis BCC8398]
MNGLPPFANAAGLTPHRQPVTATATGTVPDGTQPLRGPNTHGQTSGPGAAGPSGEHRNFPQHSQATLPHQYNQFSLYPTPSIGIQQLASWTPGPSSSHHHHQQRPEPPFPAYNAPHLRSSPHGNAESTPQSSSPMTPRYEYGFHPPHGMGNQHDPTASISPPSSYNSWPRRRESMPEMTGNGAFHQFQPVRPIMADQMDSAGSDIGVFMHPSSEMQTPLPVASSSHLPSSAWQSPFTTYPPLQTATPASISARSRGSTFGSRTTDDEGGQGVSVATGPTASVDGDGSRPNTGEKGRGGNVGVGGKVTAKDFSKKPPKKATKVEASDEMMNVEHGEADDDDEKMDHRKRKRNRTIRSCVPCHNHKRKCDRKRPCGRCTALGLTGTCVYEIDETRDMNDPDVAEADRLRKRIAELEQVIRELRQKTPARGHATSASITTPGPAASSLRAASDTTGLSPDGSVDDNKQRRVIVDRFARFKLDEAKNAENSAAAGSSGKTTPSTLKSSTGNKQISSIAGSSQASSSLYTPANTDYKKETYQSFLLPGEEMSSDKSGRKIFLGALTGKSMLRRLRELTESKGEGDLLTVPEDVALTGVFPDIRKTFPFTTIWSHENFSEEIIGLLPNAEQAEMLWHAWEEEHSAYFHPFHMPTIRAEYTNFFSMSTEEKMNTPLASLALFLILCALGCVIRATSVELFGHPDPRVAQKEPKGPIVRDPKDLTCSRLQSELYLSASFHALRLCAFLANPTLRTLQCQILVAVYLLASERAADAWAHMGTLTKQAVALGLHKDPLSLDPNVSMRDAEVRRRTWWSIAGFDCMLCIFFDRPDETLSDVPGSAQQQFPPSHVMSNETTEQTYHTAYYQLTIPSFELLDRIFQVDKRFSRSIVYGWFSPPKDSPPPQEAEEAHRHTYQDALRLAQDISQWYSHLPDGMRFGQDDSPEYLLGSRTRKQLNQTLILSMKAWTLIMALHRPYLRFDPTAYPESTAICSEAAHHILRTYKSMSVTKSTLSWSFWTMPYRAFQAGAVCAFLAIRQPGTPLAAKCMADLRGAIRLFEDRLSNWNVTHPVQAGLCEGLVRLEKLVTAATQQQASPQHNSLDPARLSPFHMSPNTFGFSPTPQIEGLQMGTPLSHLQGFPSLAPNLPSANSGPMAHSSTSSSGTNNGSDSIRAETQRLNPSVYQAQIPDGALVPPLTGDFNGPEPLVLSTFWANMFGIKMKDEEEQSPSAPQSEAP